jgi:hypothetical protein
MAIDEGLGRAYVPVEDATGDEYGGHRPGSNLFSDSLVCLDLKTGQRIWHYQLIHHDIWDRDIPSPPVLLDITVGGRTIQALAQPTKQAFLYVFDRVNGQPVWPIEERPVPKGNVPGEWYAPTQPFPTRPPAFDRQGFTLDDLIDFTPELRAEAVRVVSRYKLGSLYEPPVLSNWDGPLGTLTLPETGGGATGRAAHSIRRARFSTSIQSRPHGRLPLSKGTRAEPTRTMFRAGQPLRSASRDPAGEAHPPQRAVQAAPRGEARTATTREPSAAIPGRSQFRDCLS